MKGQLKTLQFGTLTFETQKEGIVLFESKGTAFFEGKSFKFKARIDPESATARIIHLSAHHKIQHIGKEIETILPLRWADFLNHHPSIKYVMNKSLIDKARIKKKQEIKELASRLEVQIQHLHTLIEEL